MAHRHRHVLTAALALSVPIGLASGVHAEGGVATVAPTTSSSISAAPASAGASSSASEHAEARPVVFGPVLTPTTGTEKAPARRVAATDPLALQARELEGALKEAATDLGLSIEVSGPIVGDGASELDLVKRAALGSQGVWVISPRLETVSGGLLVRIVAVPPHGTTLLVRVEKVEPAKLAVRGVVMLRDLVTAKTAIAAAPTKTEPGEAPSDEGARSRGRPVLSASATLFGLYAAFSVYKAAGSDDPRLLYPLLAIGSGIGLGGSLLGADEFDVTPGVSWTIAGGTWWGVVSGLNLAGGYDVQPVSDRYAWALAGGLLGTVLSVTAVSLTRYDEGDAALVHSGAALGMFAGGAVDLLVRGDLKGSPYRGLGVGSGAGLLAGGVLAAFTATSAQRVMMVDLGAGIGALGGAALASPLLVVKADTATAAKTRWFLGAVLTGTIVGGALGWFVTRPATSASARGTRLLPMGGVIATSIDPRTGAVVPALGGGVTGVF